jgi:hypothetical protein
MKKTTSEIMNHIQNLDFKAVGPFLVADLSKEHETLFEKLPVGKHGMEHVQLGAKTKSHQHSFASFYKSLGLDIECKSKRFKLPKYSLTLVLPGVDHSWIPKTKNGTVGSVDTRHRKQILTFA